MGRLLFAFVLAALSYAVTSEDTEHSAKHAIIQREAGLAAGVIRNIAIKTPRDSVRLANMATDAISGLHFAAYTLNNVIPNIATDGQNFKLLSAIVQNIGNVANNIQQALSGDSEKLKDALVVALETINKDVPKFGQEFKTDSNIFVNNQISRKSEFSIFAVYKLKYQAILFEKSNNELLPEMQTSLDMLTGALKSISASDKSTEKELRHITQHISIVTERAISKLENWVEVNSNRTDDVKIVQDVAKTLSELYNKEYLASAGSHGLRHLADQLTHIYQTGQTKVMELGSLEYPDNLGGEEFIRSTMMDGIIIGRAYTENLKIFLPKA